MSLILRQYVSVLQEATVSLDICAGLGSDYARGFGGKYGIQTDRQDRSAVGWDYIEKIQKHGSQKGNTLRLAWHGVACIQVVGCLHVLCPSSDCWV
jgi:hypothetical protein